MENRVFLVVQCREVRYYHNISGSSSIQSLWHCQVYFWVPSKLLSWLTRLDCRLKGVEYTQILFVLPSLGWLGLTVGELGHIFGYNCSKKFVSTHNLLLIKMVHSFCHDFYESLHFYLISEVIYPYYQEVFLARRQREQAENVHAPLIERPEWGHQL